MIEILPSASYLRSLQFMGDRSAPAVLLSLHEQHALIAPSALQRIWELLETPQTVATICRVLTSEYDVDVNACCVEVGAYLADLYAEDLIQLSPDT
jgi:hypothetical protein